MADKDLTFHMDYIEQDPNIPGTDKCPKCKVEGESGYGMAGGGTGVYTYCPNCGMILDKVQDHE